MKSKNSARQLTATMLISLTACLLGTSLANASTLPPADGLVVWLTASNVDGQNNSTLTDGQWTGTWKNLASAGTAGDAIAPNSKDVQFLANGGSGGVGPAVYFGTNSGTGLHSKLEFNEFMTSDTFTMVGKAYCTGGTGGQVLYHEYGDTSGNAFVYMGVINGVRDHSGNNSLTPSGSEFGSGWGVGEMILSKSGSDYTLTSGMVGSTLTIGTNPDYTTTTWEGSFHGSKPAMGEDYWGNTFFGYASGFLIYNRVLNPTELAAAVDYLNQVPEPSMLGLLASAFVGLLAHAWRKRRQFGIW